MLENITKTTKTTNIGSTARFSTVRFRKKSNSQVFPQCYLPSSQNLLARSTLWNRISSAKHPLSNPESTLFLLKTATWRPHKTQCFRTISTTVTLLLLHTWKKPTQDIGHCLGWETPAQETQTSRVELHCTGAQKGAGKNLILKIFFLRHLSTYFSVVSHLKETG